VYTIDNGLSSRREIIEKAENQANCSDRYEISTEASERGHIKKEFKNIGRMTYEIAKRITEEYKNKPITMTKKQFAEIHGISGKAL